MSTAGEVFEEVKNEIKSDAPAIAARAAEAVLEEIVALRRSHGSAANMPTTVRARCLDLLIELVGGPPAPTP